MGPNYSQNNSLASTSRLAMGPLPIQLTPSSTPTQASSSAYPPPRPPTAAKNSLSGKHIVSRALHPNHVGWVVPPGVIPMVQGKKIENWELADYMGTMAWVFRGKNSHIGSTKAWYDRTNGRCLYFGHHIIPPGVLDDDIFGAPVPQFAFIHPSNGGGIPKLASSWMYSSQHPSRDDRNRRPSTPDPNRLPWRSFKGPTKGSTQLMIDEDEDEDMYGDDVRKPLPSETPSNVVVVRGITGMTAIDLRREAGEAASKLQCPHATPLAIVVEPDRSLISFATTTNGLRGFGYLGRLQSSHPGLQLEFTSYRDLERAFQASTDRWISDDAYSVASAPTAPPTPSQTLQSSFSPGIPPVPIPCSNWRHQNRSLTPVDTRQNNFVAHGLDRDRRRGSGLIIHQ